MTTPRPQTQTQDEKLYCTYKAFNRVTQAIVYVGITSNLAQRIKQHTKRSSWWNPNLQFEAIERDLSVDDARAREKCWIEHFESHGHVLQNFNHNIDNQVARMEEQDRLDRLAQEVQESSDLPEGEFGGFTQPTANWYRTPNVWTDICAGIDNLAEVKIIQYVLRHTWGYQEYGVAKTISVDEFMYGRKRTDGSRMDKGTGLKSDRSVKDGIKLAIQHGYLVCETDETDLARIKKSYALKMSSEPEGYNLPPGNRGVVSTPQTGSIYPSGGQHLPLGGATSTPRSEKDTLERHFRKTPKERESSNPENLPTPNVGSAIASPEHALFVHPEFSYLLFDDLMAPSLMVLMLTDKKWGALTEKEDKVRGWKAEEVKNHLAKRGVHVTLRIEHEIDHPTVIESQGELNGNSHRHQPIGTDGISPHLRVFYPQSLTGDQDRTETAQPTQGEVSGHNNHLGNDTRRSGAEEVNHEPERPLSDPVYPGNPDRNSGSSVSPSQAAQRDTSITDGDTQTQQAVTQPSYSLQSTSNQTAPNKTGSTSSGVGARPANKTGYTKNEVSSKGKVSNDVEQLGLPLTQDIGPLVMPAENAPWSAGTLMLISEVLRGRRYTDNQRKGETEAAKAMLKEFPALTRELFIEAFLDRKKWNVEHNQPLVSVHYLMQKGYKSNDLRMQQTLDILEAKRGKQSSGQAQSRPAWAKDQHQRAGSPTADLTTTVYGSDYDSLTSKQNQLNIERYKARIEAKKARELAQAAV